MASTQVDKVRLISIFKNNRYKSKQKMQNRNKFDQKLYLHYYQFIQFLNQYTFTPSVALVLVWWPNLIVFFDILLHLRQDSDLLTKITSLSLTQILQILFEETQVFLTVCEALIIFCLLLPLMILIGLTIQTAREAQQPMDNARNLSIKYEQSTFLKIIRLYFKTYKQITFPILLSFSIKILKIQASQHIFALGILIVILLFVNLFAFIYYDLEIHLENSKYCTKNHTGLLIYFCLLGATILVIDLTNDLLPFILGASLYLLILLISIHIEIFNQRFETHRKFSCTVLLVTFVCLLLSKVSSEKNMMILTWVILALALVLFIRKMLAHSFLEDAFELDQSNELLSNEEQELQTINVLKQQLWNKQKFIQTFQQLIKLSRQKNSHRQHLIIEILKSKCYKKQIISSGGSKISNPIDLFKYQLQITTVVEIFLELVENSQEIFRVMKEKEIYEQIFMKKVMINRKLLEKGKEELEKALKINSSEPKGMFLLHLLCKSLQNDHEFLKEKYEEFRDEILSHVQLKARDKLFSQNVALIVINIMEEIGKITQMTNNITGILGYKSHHLINLPINGLMPFTIREIHDEMLTGFIKNFDCSTQRKNPKIYSYAYNKDFQLQKVGIQYKFLMNDFETLSLSGIMEKLDAEETIIMTDSKGNIEGWNKEAGELLKLDEIAGAGCRSYNLLPFLPALIKYKQQEFCCKTLLFRPSKVKNPKLAVISSMKSWQSLYEKQIEAFNALLQNEQIIDIFYVEMQVRVANYLGGKNNNRYYEIKKFKQIQNIQHILNKLSQKASTLQKQESDPPAENIFDRMKTNTEQSSDYSLVCNSRNQKNLLDLNFSLDGQEAKKLFADDIQISKDIYNSYTFVSNKSIFKNIEAGRPEFDSFEKQVALITDVKPKIKKQIQGFVSIILLTVFFIGILFYDQVSLLSIYKQLDYNTSELKKLSRVQMILAKSIFNPNSTYIDEFRVGNLMLKDELLKHSNFSFLIESNQPKVNYSYFYLLNVQIPSMLDSLVSIQDSNRQEFFQYQLYENFQSMIQMFSQVQNNQSAQWKQIVQVKKIVTIVVNVVVSIGIIICSVYIIYVRYEHSARLKTIEGFFKFQKTDIDEIISKIVDISNHLRIKLTEWNIEDNQAMGVFLEQGQKSRKPKKHKTITFDQHEIKQKSKDRDEVSQMNKNPLQQILKMNEEKKIGRKYQFETKQTCYGFIGIIFFVFLQIVFVITYGVLNASVLSRAEEIFQDIKRADKLFIQPNILLSQLYTALPIQVVDKFKQQSDLTIDLDANRLPELYQLLEEAPCTNCEFLPEILKTNYRSFYSYFTKTVQLKIENSDTSDLQELIYAADIVADKIYSVIKVPDLPHVIFLIILYIASLIVFYITLVNAMKQIDEHTNNLQVLLKYFDNQIINKNKHLNAIFDKND